MDKTAGLKFEVDSTAVSTAAQRLDNLTSTGAKADAAAQRVSRSWAAAAQSMARDLTAAGAKFDQLNTTQTRMLAAVERVADSVTKLADVTSRAAARAANLGAATDSVTKAVGATGAAAENASRSVQRLAETEEQAAARIKAMVAASMQQTAQLNRQIDATNRAATAGANAARTEQQSGAQRRATLEGQRASMQQTANEVNAVNRALSELGKGSSSMQALQANTERLVSLWNQGAISATQYDAALKQLDADEKRLVTTQAQATQAADAFIAKLKEEAATLGMTRKQLLEYQAAKLGVSGAATPYIQKLTDVNTRTKALGVSVGQTTQAMRMLPAQLTDVVTQLAGGQNPLLILIQQGGQTKDMFGGFGPMFRALAGAITPLKAGLTVLGAALVSTGVAFAKGQAETQRFGEALILTGNYAGTTTSQMSAMARQVSEISGGGKTRAAADALTQLAQSALFTAENMPLIAQAAVAMQSAMKKPIGDTIAEFERLAREPTKASEELNRQTGFLTVSLYEKIRALEESGRKSEAASVAERAHAQATIDAASRVKENLGVLERSWRNVWGAAKGAWDAMKNLGREGTDDDLRAQIATNQRLQAALEARGGNGVANNGLGRLIQRAMGTPPVQSIYQQRIQALQTELNKREVEAANADAQGVSRRASQRAIDATGTVMGILRTAKDPSAKTADLENLKSMALDIWSNAQINPNEAGSLAKRLQYDPDTGKFSGELWDTLQRSMEERYKDSSGAAQANRAVQAQVAAVQASTRSEVNTLRESVAEQRQLRDVGATNLTEYYDNVYTLQASSLQRQLGLAQKEVDLNKGEAQVSARAAAQGRVEEIQRQIEANETEHVNNLRSIRQGVEKGIVDLSLGWEQQADAATAATAAEVAMYGKTDNARRIASAGLKVENDYRKYLYTLKEAGIELTDKELRKLNEVYDAAKEGAEQREADLLAAQGAQQLYEQNEQFGINMLVNEQDRANALVEIERRKWLALIEAATKGSEARANLEAEYRKWDANQAAAPALNQQRRLQQEQIRSWGQVIDNVGSTFRTGFADMLNDGKAGWDSFTKSLKTTFKTTVIDSLYTAFAKPLTVSLLAEVAGITGGDAVKNGILQQNGMSSSSLGGLSGLFSAGKGIYDMMSNPKWFSDFGGTLAGTLENWGWQNMGSDMFGDLSASIINNSESIAQFANVAGDVLGYGTAVLNAFNGKFGSAVGGAIGTYFGGPIGSFIGSQIGAMVDGMLAGEKRFGGTWALNQEGKAQFSHGPSGGTAGADKAMAQGIDSTVGAINTMLRQLGSTATVASFSAGLETSEKGRGGVIGVGTLSTGAAFGQGNLAGNNYKGTYYSSNFSTSPDLETAFKEYGTLMKQVTLEALQAATDLPNAIKAQLEGVETGKLTDEAATELLNTISSMTQQVKQFENAVERLPFANLRNLTFDAYHSLIAFSGGMESLTSNMNTYFENYFSKEEQMATSFSGLENTFKGLGLTIPFTKDSFMELVKTTGDAGGAAQTARAALRSLIEAQDNTTTSGQLVTATLLGISGSFAEWVEFMQGEGQKFLDNKATSDKELEDAPKKAMDDLTKEFERMLGNVRDAAQRANAALGNRNAAGSIRDRIDGALNRTGGTAAAAREQQLWAALSTANMEQQIGLAEELTSIALNRYQEEIAAQERLRDIAASIRESVQSTRISEQSPLTLGQKLAEAQKQFSDAVQKAAAGDEDAAGELVGLRGALLDLASRYYASGSQYTDIFNSTEAALSGLATQFESESSLQLGVSQETLTQLTQLRSIADSTYTAFDRQYQQAVGAARDQMIGLEKIATETGRLSDVTALLESLPAELASALQVMLPQGSVNDWYQQNLGRAPDAAGNQYWLDQIAKNGTGATRDEFNQASKNEQWLAQIYRTVLGREMDAAGRDFWLDALVNRGHTRAEVEASIRASVSGKGYAQGGATTTGLAWVGENGRELVDFRSPARVYSNDDLSAALSRPAPGNNVDASALIQSLMQQVRDLKTAVVEAVNNSGDRVSEAVLVGSDHVASSTEDAVSRRDYANQVRASAGRLK